MYKLQRKNISGISPIVINDADNDIANIEIEGDLIEIIEGEKSPDNPSQIIVLGNDTNLIDGVFRQGAFNNTTGTTRLYTTQNLFLQAGTYTFNTNLDISLFRVSISGAKIPFPVTDVSDLTFDTSWKTQQKITFTLPEAAYLGIAISRVGEADLTVNDISSYWFKVEKGITSKKYSPYGYGTIEVSNTDGENKNSVINYVKNPLCRIGDVRDKLDYNARKIKRRCKYAVLDGTENWAKSGNTNNISFYYATETNNNFKFSDIKKDTIIPLVANIYDDVKSQIICDKFNNITSNELFVEGKIGVLADYRADYYDVTEIRVALGLNSTITTVEEFVKSLQENPITIFYISEEEEEEILLPEITENNTNDFFTYQGYNLISLEDENGLKPILTTNYQPYFSDEIKKEFRSGTTRGYLVVTRTGFVINEENYLKDIKIEELRFVPDVGIFGGTVAKRATINFNNVDNSFSIEDEDIEVHIGVEYNGTVYYINFGNFIVQKPETENTTDNTSFEALDYMIKLNGKFKDRLTYPCEMLDIALDICEQAGIELGDYNFRNNHFIVTDNQFVNGESNRVVASAIAYSAFSWARIGNDNKLYFDFEKKDNTSEEIDYDNYYNLNFNDKLYGPINRIILRNSQVDGENVTLDDDESIALNGIHELVIEDNPFAYTQEKRQELIQAASALFGFYYMPLNNVNLTGYIYLDCNDLIGFVDMQQNRIVAYPFNHTITYDGVLLDEIESPAMTETQTKYIFKPELTEAYKNTQLIVNKHDQTIIGLIQKTDETNDRLTQALQDLEGFKFSVSSSGGNNLIKNSVGWAELDFWETYTPELFDGQMETGSIDVTTNSLVTVDTAIRTKNYITVKENQDYNLKCSKDNYNLYVFCYNANYEAIGHIDVLTSRKFTTLQNTKYIKFRTQQSTTENDLSTTFSLKEVIDITTNKSDEVVKNSLSKSAFQLDNGIMKQSFEVELGKSYSIGFKIKKPLVGTGYVKIVGDTVLKEFNFETAKEYTYESFDYTFKANTQIITVEIYSDCGMIITDLIANTGDILSQWQPYAQELYALGVQIDSNGVKTYDNISEQEVQLTPTGLSGYYQRNQVFTINKDTTETEKFLAKKEINMPPIKIIAVDTGWDFVYMD